MIFDWYNGGDWGGLPVRRLGHIQADMINAFSALHRVVGVTNAYGAGVNPFGPRAMKKNRTQTVSLATDPAALASWFDGIPVGGQVTTGDPMRYNLRVALSMLNALCEEAEPDEPQFLQDDLETTVTAEYLGIDGLDAEDPIRPQDVTPWAKVRDAYEALRYLRGPVLPLVSRDVSAKASANNLTDINNAIAELYAARTYSEASELAFGPWIRVSAFSSPAQAILVTPEWVRFDLKGPNGLNGTPLERVPLVAYIKISYPSISATYTIQQDWPTSRGDIVVGTGYEETVENPGDYIQFDSEMIEPLQFESGDGIGASSLVTRGAYQPSLDTSSYVVWDLHDTGAS
jgi:hypothetical protein